MLDRLRRYGARIWLKKHQRDALTIESHMLSGKIDSYTYGCCVLLISDYARPKQIIDSLAGIRREWTIQRKVEVQRRKSEIAQQKKEKEEQDNDIE